MPKWILVSGNVRFRGISSSPGVPSLPTPFTEEWAEDFWLLMNCTSTSSLLFWAFITLLFQKPRGLEFALITGALRWLTPLLAAFLSTTSIWPTPFPGSRVKKLLAWSDPSPRAPQPPAPGYPPPIWDSFPFCFTLGGGAAA